MGTPVQLTETSTHALVEALGKAPFMLKHIHLGYILIQSAQAVQWFS